MTHKVEILRSAIKLSDFELKRAIDIIVSSNNNTVDCTVVPYGAFDLESTTYWYESKLDFNYYLQNPSHRMWGEPKLLVKCERSGLTVSEEFNMSPQHPLLTMPTVEKYVNQTLLYMYHSWLNREGSLVWKRHVHALKG